MNRESRGSGGSDKSGKLAGQGTLRPHGGYRKLRSFQVAEVIYDGTVVFCDRFLDARRTRLVDQMEQAARSAGYPACKGTLAL